MRRVLEDFLRKELGTSKLKYSPAGGGCISEAQSYETDTGKVFVKSNEDPKAKVMFDGEFAGLEALHNTQTVRVPKPIKVLAHPSGQGWVCIMEHVDMRRLDKHQAVFGEQLARLHLHNLQLREAVLSGGENSGYVDKFGFHCTTCCGFIPLCNEWSQDWVEFYTNNRLRAQVDLVTKKNNNAELKRLWTRLEKQIPSFFDGIEVHPSLLHGDVWSGNVQETDEGPVAFDPAVFYGHHEFDLAIAAMFGGFNQHLYAAYHSLIPKAPGFEQRHKLYLLFHKLNHWNHFGGGYESQTLNLMAELCR